MSITVRCHVCGEWRAAGELARSVELPFRCLACVATGRTAVDEPSELDRLREQLDAANIERADLSARLEDAESEARAERIMRERAEREKVRLRAALATYGAHDASACYLPVGSVGPFVCGCGLDDARKPRGGAG